MHMFTMGYVYVEREQPKVTAVTANDNDKYNNNIIIVGTRTRLMVSFGCTQYQLL